MHIPWIDLRIFVFNGFNNFKVVGENLGMNDFMCRNVFIGESDGIIKYARTGPVALN